MEIASIQEWLDQKYIRFRRNIRFAISSSKKEAERLYNSRFDPFYKWKAGKLSGTEIRDELIHFKEKGSMSPKLDQSDEQTIVEFALLFESYQAHSKGKHPKDLGKEEWLRVKEAYLVQSKREKEQFYAHTLHENNKQTGGAREYEAYDLLKEDIKELLGTVYPGEWTVVIKEISNSGFNCKTGIACFALPKENEQELLNEAGKKLQDFFFENYGANKFGVSSEGDAVFIEGHFVYDPEY